MSSAAAAASAPRPRGSLGDGYAVCISYLRNREAAETVAQDIEQAGGKVVKEKMSIGQYGFIVLATDTGGNMIGLHSMR